MKKPYKPFSRKKRPSSAKDVRHRLVSAWRGVEEPDHRLRKEKMTGDVLGKLLPTLGIAEVSEEEVLASWQSVAGPMLSGLSRPDSLKKGVLTINVLQPTVRFELERMRPQLLAEIRKKFGNKVVKEIAFRHGA